MTQKYVRTPVRMSKRKAKCIMFFFTRGLIKAGTSFHFIASQFVTLRRCFPKSSCALAVACKSTSKLNAATCFESEIEKKRAL